LIDDFVRDKDAVSACCLIAEIAAVMKNKGKTLQDYLNDIYLKYGFYKEEQLSIVKTGKNGLFEISKMMNHLREKFPKKINKSKVVKIVDYFFGKGYDFENSTFFDTNLPISDVIQFFTADGSKVTIRPSGTEPKIKFYFSVNEKIVSKEQYADMEQLLAKRIEDIIVSLIFK
jgi:phosphoglucomutase